MLGDHCAACTVQAEGKMHPRPPPLTVQHALHEGRGAQVAAADDVDEDQEVGGQAEEQRGDEGARDREQAQRAKVAEELALLRHKGGAAAAAGEHPVCSWQRS